MTKTIAMTNTGEAPVPTSHTVDAMSTARTRSRLTSNARRSKRSAKTPPAAPNRARGPSRATAAIAMSAVPFRWPSNHTRRPTQKTASPSDDNPSAATSERSCVCRRQMLCVGDARWASPTSPPESPSVIPPSPVRSPGRSIRERGLAGAVPAAPRGLAVRTLECNARCRMVALVVVVVVAVLAVLAFFAAVIERRRRRPASRIERARRWRGTSGPQSARFGARFRAWQTSLRERSSFSWRCSSPLSARPYWSSRFGAACFRNVRPTETLNPRSNRRVVPPLRVHHRRRPARP